MLSLVCGLGLFFSSCSGEEEENGNNSGKNTTYKNLGNGIYQINGHRFVDLGLPSGLLWAETNIGAKTATDDGNFFAWGETETKSYYSWDTYKYGTSYSYLTKYNSTDKKIILDNEDDAAYINWGVSCHMPTYDDFSELMSSDNCSWTWTSMTNSTNSSIEGYKITSKKNGNSIFLPASGDKRNNEVPSGTGSYWSSRLSSSFQSAYYFDFGWSHFVSYQLKDGNRCYGRTIRPVAKL